MEPVAAFRPNLPFLIAIPSGAARPSRRAALFSSSTRCYDPRRPLRRKSAAEHSSFTGNLNRWLLPPIVGKGSVRLRHAVGVFLFLDGGTPVVKGIEQFPREPLYHALLCASPRERDQPSYAQARAAVRTDLHRDLVVGAAHTARFYFHHGFHVFHGFLEDLERILLRPLFDLVHGFIKNRFGN